MKVTREEILDYETYEDLRPEIRAEAMRAKGLRRVHVGEHLTFLFENRETVRYQILEMVRAERMVRETDIRREIETYNELIGGPGELGCTLLIEIENPSERRQKLAAWTGLPESVYLVLENGSREYARADRRQASAEKISAVQFLRFECGESVPLAVGCDLVGLEAETRLTDAQRDALREDLPAQRSDS